MTTDTTSGETGKKSGRTVTLTAEDMQKKKNDVKARTTLLLSLPDEHQLLQVIVGQLQFMDVEIEQDDLKQKFLTSLAPEWLMHTIVWRNKSDHDTISLDDLYNHLKVYESEVQKKSEPNSQNMAFISSAKHSSGNEDGNTACVPIPSTNVSTASASVATISQDTACAYIASQSNGSQIKFEDINQIDEDDIEEMDIKWNMALLSMRADKFWKKTGKKISIQGSDVVGFDKSKVECFNCHKIGHFVRECRAPRSQDRGRRDNYRQWSKAKEQAPKALMAIDGVGWDWSYMANDEEDHAIVADEVAPTKFSLMANTNAESKVFDNSLCSKDCKKNNDSLNSKITNLTDKLFDAKNMIYHYKLGLAQVESRLVEYKEREVKYREKIRTLEFRTESNNECIKILKKKVETLKQEKEWTGLPEFADDTVTDYSRPSPTMESTSGDDQNKNPSVSETVASPITPKPFIKFVKPKDSQSKSKTDETETPKKPPVKKRVKKSFTPKPVAHRPYRPPVRPVRTNMNGTRPNRTSFNKQAHSYANRPFHRTSAVRSQYRVPWVPTVNRNFPPVNRKFSTGNINFPTANRKFPTSSTKCSTADMGIKGKAGISQNNIDDKGYWDNGCSRHMTENISYLSDYEPFDGGYVSFGQGGCKITSKGTIKTGKLEFENVYFMKDLKYNLFSVSQMCDNKNSVLFTDLECIVLGRDFKLLDDANILLRTPRQHNMYSIDLNNIFPHRDLTCLVAKASADECMLWHRRLRHLNFKTMNKLVRHNLVRGLPTKCFKNDHTCTACLKGKQHKASCKSKLVNSVSKPIHTLHMDLFGLTSISSISHKWYCLVVTDNFFRFIWTFFLKSKDETSGILKKFITKIKNLKDLKVKIIRCDYGGEFRNKEINDFCSQKEIKREFSNARTPQQNGVTERRNRTLIEVARTMLADAKLPVTFWAEAANTACYVQNRVLVNKSHNKTPYELFNGRSPAIGFLKLFGCHVMILNTLDNLGKFKEKGDGEFLENKAIEKGAGPNWLFYIDSSTKSMNYVPMDAAHDALLESSSSKPQDHCSTEVPEGSRNLNPTASTSNPPADPMEIQTVESLIPTVSSPVPTVYSTDSQEPSNESNGVEADINNMETAIIASPTPTLRIHKDHPKKPKKIFDALQDPIWIEAMQEELLQFKILNVWTLVDCPKGVRPIGTKWVLKNKKDERGIVSQASGSRDLEFLAKVYEVEKAMYGLHQAPRAWYGTSKYWGVLRILMISLRLIPLSEHNVDFHPMVDFIEASPLRTVTESSLRQNLKIQDEEGINEPESPLRDVSQGEACPTNSGFIADQDRVTIAKSSTLPHDSAPRVTSLTVDEGTHEIEITRLKAIVKLLEDRQGVAAEGSGDDAPIKERNLDEGEAAAKRASDDTEEMATILTSMDATTVLAKGAAEVPTGSGSIPTAGPHADEVPTGSDVVPTASPVFATATVVTSYRRRKGKEVMVESKTPKKQKVQEYIDAQVAKELEEQLEREDQRRSEQIARDAEIARIHAEEELQIMIDELPIKRRIELISNMVKYQDNYAKIYKFQSQQRKPWTKKQKRDYYMAVIRSNLGWKVKDFRGMTFEELEAKFNSVWKQMEDFIPMGSKEEAEWIKRKGLSLEQESAKKQKTSKEVTEEAKSPDEVLEEKVKEMMQLVPIKEVYVEALQVKHPIIDWKVDQKVRTQLARDLEIPYETVQKIVVFMSCQSFKHLINERERKAVLLSCIVKFPVIDTDTLSGDRSLRY
nr:hypothetical protein [Tanacetum cinerariifolium]